MSGWSGPLYDGHQCSLGYEIVGAIEAFMCFGEGDLQGQAAGVDNEMLAHIVECYRLDPATGRRVYDEAVLSRPKGRAKSEVAAWVALVEGFLPCRFDGWDANGQPVAAPVTSPLIKILATEESQTGNTFSTVAFVAGEWGKDNHPDVYGGATGVRQYQSASAIYLPHGGEMRACTSGAASKDGGKETHVVADETHLYVLPALQAMYSTVARNLGKRKIAQPWMHQTSTAYRPGEQSVFEQTLTMWRKGELSERVYVNHREAKGAIDLDNEERTKAQLRYVYGDSAGWQDFDRKYAERNDPRIYKTPEEFVRYALNRPMSGRDAWIAKDVHDRQTRTDVVEMGESITLGFDGSLNDDATILRGCRMSDGFLFRIGAWPKPEGPAGIGWQVPRLEVLAAIREAFGRYDVVRGYFDPHEWRSDIEALTEEFGDERVVEFPTSAWKRMAGALDRLHTGLTVGEVWHDDDPLAAEHYGNVYVQMRGGNRLIRKEYPNSPRKIDSVVGDALALEARADALAEGWGVQRSHLTRVTGRVSAR